MDTNIYQAKFHVLLRHLSEQGYSGNYIGQFKTECGKLLAYLSSSGSLEGFLQNYSTVFGLKLYKCRTCIINLIIAYLKNGNLPSRRHHVTKAASSYDRLPASFRTIVDSYIISRNGELSPSSRWNERSTLSSFLLHLCHGGKELHVLQRIRHGHVSMIPPTMCYCVGITLPTLSTVSFEVQKASPRGRPMHAFCRWFP